VGAGTPLRLDTAPILWAFEVEFFIE